MPMRGSARATRPPPRAPRGVLAVWTGTDLARGALPAVMNAVLDALAPLGVRRLDMPATAERVWQAIQAAQATGAEAG